MAIELHSKKAYGYTIMPNHHLRNMNLSLEARGLFSLILSLPEGWEYSLLGLSKIRLEGACAIRRAMRELEREGYIARARVRNAKGQYGGAKYAIRALPAQNAPVPVNPTLEKPAAAEAGGYTKMSNQHLRNMELTMKAIGLLSLIFSLPRSWNCTIAGLSQICRESRDAIRMAIKELEREGYIVRSRARNAKGQYGGMKYAVRELPMQGPPSPAPDAPAPGKPMLENPTQENRSQTNKDQTSKEIIYISKKIHPSCPSIAPKENRVEGMERCREMIKENISYEFLKAWFDGGSWDREILDGLVEIMAETASSAKTHIRVAGEIHPARLVRERFLKINSLHIRYVLKALRENATPVRNPRAYMLAALFNAPATMQCHTQASVNYNAALELACL